MALTDIHFQEGEVQDFIIEIPSAIYSGLLTDILIEPSGSQYCVVEVDGGNIFIVGE